ncbi:hypothetical protein [Pyrodictium abyssi]|uniref:Uncharacterized protein n=1 Tax=Pyrodictium abyssi TaxID=54256 RepID=A0ABM8IXB9_9CREN|nr:hypothetical protein PABY_08270 [Pyrodictium abyssi]
MQGVRFWRCWDREYVRHVVVAAPLWDEALLPRLEAAGLVDCKELPRGHRDTLAVLYGTISATDDLLGNVIQLLLVDRKTPKYRLLEYIEHAVKMLDRIRKMNREALEAESNG